ncbi:hypothetical protein WK69_10815 [Burkholderia ubonensis]|uniref:hypothetical protein n=1 Tax=Burkholderia ubonensis TaxID=101571 RepID=UPI0007522147|nr:hypothetical protein [Burkholderia ubonensis]KVU48193.1 hypothetical protein WK69_10815 [Burkholderia ubonensis]
METINDGGPAFPINDHQFEHRVGAAAVEGVTDSAERDRIYTEATARASAGMSLRDYFAAKSMAAMLTHDVNGDWPDHKNVAKHAYDMADEMLHARGA